MFQNMQYGLTKKFDRQKILKFILQKCPYIRKNQKKEIQIHYVMSSLFLSLKKLLFKFCKISLKFSNDMQEGQTDVYRFKKTSWCAAIK